MKSKQSKTASANKRRLHGVVRAMACELHAAGLKEVRRREKRNDGVTMTPYEYKNDRLIYAMEGIAKHVIKHYRPNV